MTLEGLKEAEKYINEQVPTIEDTMDGAKLIIAQNISENAKIRGQLEKDF